MFIKLPAWRQANPRDQLVAVYSALEGHRSNLITGVIDTNKYLRKTALLMKYLEKLTAKQDLSTWAGE